MAFDRPAVIAIKAIEGIEENMQALANDLHCAAPRRRASAPTDTLFVHRCEAGNRAPLRIPLRSGRVFIVSGRLLAIGPDGRFFDRLPLRAMPRELHAIATGVLGAIKRLISRAEHRWDQWSTPLARA